VTTVPGATCPRTAPQALALAHHLCWLAAVGSRAEAAAIEATDAPLSSIGARLGAACERAHLPRPQAREGPRPFAPRGDSASGAGPRRLVAVGAATSSERAASARAFALLRHYLGLYLDALHATPP
jgi:hypothetical protein